MKVRSSIFIALLLVGSKKTRVWWVPLQLLGSGPGIENPYNYASARVTVTMAVGDARRRRYLLSE